MQAGCGSKTYEDRLTLTQSYFDFIERLNRNLSPQFSLSGTSLRVPIQFQEITAPPRRPREQEGEEQVDPRQPDYLRFQLPGMLGAWKTDLNTVSSGDGSTSTQTGYLYLLGNYNDWMTFKTPKEKADPTKFHENLITVLSSGLRINIDPRARASSSDRVNKWSSEIVPTPRDEQFVARKEFTTITLVPEEIDELRGKEFRLYLYQNGDMKIALLYVLPQNIGGGENLEDLILLSLPTVNVSPEKPRAVPGGTSGAAPKPPGTSI